MAAWVTAWALALPVAVLAGCHVADIGWVKVPERDGSPPAVRVALMTPRGARILAEASQPPGRPPAAGVELATPRLRGTTVGEDFDGGVTRVRVSISELIACRGADGRRFERRRRRYFPPPQIERIRAAPGARLPRLRTRSLQLSLVGSRCGHDADAVEVQG